LWIGYGGDGLGRLKDGRFSQCRMGQGLHDDFISQILTDQRGRLWLAGNRGIFSVREHELDEVAAGRVSRVQAVAYGQHEGLPRLQASHGTWPGALRDKNGSLWFAMQSGYAVVQAENLKDNPDPPAVVLERVTVNGKTVAAYGAGEAVAAPATSTSPAELGQGTARLRVLPGQRQVEFTFTAPSFKLPESLVFKYRLHGLDKGWVEAGHRRTASYPQVPAGDYRFQVLVCSSDGVWNETGAAVALTVMPNWWETAWFRVLAPLAAVGLLGGGGLLVLRRRHRRQIEHLRMQQATERERVRIAQDLHDDLGSNLTQIAYLGDTLLNRPGLPAELVGDVVKICAAARDSTRSLDETVWAVAPDKDTLESLAGYLASLAQELLANAGVACRLDFPATLPGQPVSSELRHGLFLAFKEALHNIIRHAHATEVNIRLVNDPPEWLLVIADNGCGFEPASVTSDGHGLANIRSRLTTVGGHSEMTSQPGAGTQWRLIWKHPS
jgi:signal transduction histidine kinase